MDLAADIPVPSAPQKRRVTNDGHVMKPAITHRGKEIAGDPFISEPASDGDSQHRGDEDEDGKSTTLHDLLFSPAESVHTKYPTCFKKNEVHALEPVAVAYAATTVSTDPSDLLYLA